jgi:hypothetical protein
MMQFNYFESNNERIVPLTDLWEFCQDREVTVEPSAFVTYLNYDYGDLEYAEGEAFIDLRFPGYTVSVSPAEALKIAESLVILVGRVKESIQ